jgi:hypothetical protein
VTLEVEETATKTVEAYVAAITEIEFYDPPHAKRLHA